jgi:hypothetical protein
MSNIILRRESRRLAMVADAMIWDGFSPSMRMTISLAHFTEAIGHLIIGTFKTMFWVEEVAMRIEDLIKAWGRIPRWRRIWLRICFWIGDIFKGVKRWLK